MSTLGQWETLDQLTIYGGKATLDRIQDLAFKIVFRGGRPPIQLDFVEIQPGVILKGEDFDVLAFPVQHVGRSTASYFRSIRGGPSSTTKRRSWACRPGLSASNLSKPAHHAGPWPSDSTRGCAGATQSGTRLVMTGDTTELKGLESMIRNADALVTEATYMDVDAGLARDNAH